MHLKLVRDILMPNFTLGILYVDDQFQCYTCEDTVRGDGDPATVAQWKQWGITAIPYGTYPVDMRYSPHFGKDMAHVENVPGFTEIMIHNGNTTKDTDGCVLVGTMRDNNAGSVQNSILALEDLMKHLQIGFISGDMVTLEIAEG